MAPLCSRQGATESRGGGTLNLLQLDSRDRPAALCQRCIVSRSLRLDEPAEAEVLAGDRQLVSRVVDDLEEAADRRAALVELPGRVQIPRAEPERDDAARLLPEPLDERPQPLLLGRVDERLDGYVVALARLRKQLVGPGRLYLRIPSFGQNLSRSLLRLLDVRLVERVD